jgi:hypothetical protein
MAGEARRDAQEALFKQITELVDKSKAYNAGDQVRMVKELAEAFRSVNGGSAAS